MDSPDQGRAGRGSRILHVPGLKKPKQVTSKAVQSSQVNTDPMISMTGHLDVVVPPTIIDEESSPSTVSVREKHNASLICKSHGV